MGNWCSTMSLSIPETMALSTGLTEEARTRTSTSFGAVCEVGISCRVGLVSKLSRMMARIVYFSSLGCLLCLTLHGGICTRVTYTRFQNLSSIHRSAWKGFSANFCFTEILRSSEARRRAGGEYPRPSSPGRSSQTSPQTLGHIGGLGVAGNRGREKHEIP